MIYLKEVFITARIRRMREGNIFSLSTLAGGEGVPRPRTRRGVSHPGVSTHPRLDRVSPIQTWDRGAPRGNPPPHQ